MIQAVERIRERRTPITGRVAYHTESGETGPSTWLNVSRVGAAIRLGRYFRPGKRLSLRFASPLWFDADVEIAARVAWCHPLPGGIEFAAGLQVLRHDPESVVAFAALGYAAQRDEKAASELKSDHQPEEGLRLAQAI